MMNEIRIGIEALYRKNKILRFLFFGRKFESVFFEYSRVLSEIANFKGYLIF